MIHKHLLSKIIRQVPCKLWQRPSPTLNTRPFTMATDSHSTKVYAISDIHVDYKGNRSFVESWSSDAYKEDVLIVAGDVTDNLPLMKATLQALKQKFKEVFFVPGNHDVWLRSNESEEDSISKFNSILNLCDSLDVHCYPKKLATSPTDSVWIVPLFSWYAKPEEDLGDSLYITPTSFKENVESMEKMWMDNHLCKWPKLPEGLTPSKYFALKNEEAVMAEYDAPVISFSHFLPRQDLIRPSEAEASQVEKERKEAGLGPPPALQGGTKDFNFSRYAGCKILESQIRTLKSAVHIHGHQHRNRDRVIQGTRYVSHCLGYHREQTEGWVWGITQWKGPKQVWPLDQCEEKS